MLAQGPLGVTEPLILAEVEEDTEIQEIKKQLQDLADMKLALLRLPDLLAAAQAEHHKQGACAVTHAH